MKKYYHVTSQEALASIRQHGLIPQIGQSAGACEEAHPGVYLFTDRVSLEDALMNWLGDVLSERLGEDAALAIVEVSLTDEEARSLESSIAAYEVISRVTITPEHLTFYDEAMNLLG